MKKVVTQSGKTIAYLTPENKIKIRSDYFASNKDILKEYFGTSVFVIMPYDIKL